MITKARESQLRKYAVIIALEAIDEDVPAPFKDNYTPKTVDEFQYVLEEQQNIISRIFKAIHYKASKGELLNDIEMGNLLRGRKTWESARQGGHARREAEKHLYNYDRLLQRIRRKMEDNPHLSFSRVRKICAQKMGISEAAAKKHIKKVDL